MRFTIQGKVLSKVECHKEREFEAERKNITIDKVPLKYGSVRIAVNLIKLGQEVYIINKETNESNVKEERLILEISYKFDNEGNVIEDHDIINDFQVKEELEMIMDDAFVSKNHYLKFINTTSNQVIKSYFLKSWANKIYFLNCVEAMPADGDITPKEVIKQLNLNDQLVIV